VSVEQFIKMAIGSCEVIQIMMKPQLLRNIEKCLDGHLDKRHVKWFGYELGSLTWSNKCKSVRFCQMLWCRGGGYWEG
jgi:hypothetical protein